MKRLSIGGAALAYEESGRGSPAIFFVHGNSSSSGAFERQFEDPSLRPFRKVAPDLPGHGASPPLDGGSEYTLGVFSDAVADAARALGMEEAVFVGHSFGGHLIVQTLDRLPKARGLVLSGTPLLGRPPDLAGAFLPSPAMGSLFKGTLSDAEVEGWARACVAPEAPPPPAILRDVRRTDPRVRDGLGKALASGGTPDERAVVEGLRIPLALFHGELDALVRLPYLRGIRAPTLWRGAVQVIPGAGHSPHWERPEAFDRLLLEFLRSLPA